MLSNLEPGTIYNYMASSSDQARNGPVESAINSFRTASRPQLPAFTSGPVAEADESSATITWQTNVSANTIVDIGVDTGYGMRVEKRELSQGHEAVFNNLDPGTKYHFKVTSIDLSGNVLTTDPNGFELHSRDLTLRTLAEANVQPPRLMENPTTVWTDKSVVVSWETDEASTSRIEWEALSKVNGPNKGFVEDNQMLFQHSLTLTGLQPRTLYAVRVISEDAAGNQMVWEPTAAGKLVADGLLIRVCVVVLGKLAQPPGGAGLFVTDSFQIRAFQLLLRPARARENGGECNHRMADR